MTVRYRKSTPTRRRAAVRRRSARRNPRIEIQRGELISSYEPYDLPGAFIITRFKVHDSQGQVPSAQINWSGHGEWIDSMDGMPKGHKALWLGSRQTTRPFVVFVEDKPTTASDEYDKGYRKGFTAKRKPRITDKMSRSTIDGIMQGWQDSGRVWLRRNARERQLSDREIREALADAPDAPEIVEHRGRRRIRIKMDPVTLAQALGLLGPAARNPRKRRGRRRNAAGSKPTRRDKVIRAVAHAISSGVVIHFRSAWVEGTIGPYQTAVPGNEKFAIFFDRNRKGQTGRWTFPTARNAADNLFEFTGTGALIAAIKTAAKKRGLHYSNLDTPIPWNSSRARARRKVVAARPRAMPIPKPVWDVIQADRDGKPVVRQWRLPRMTGLHDIVIWDEKRGSDGKRYAILYVNREARTSARATEVARASGMRFARMSEVRAFLRDLQQQRSRP